MPSITSRTVTKPSIQTIESTIKAPLQDKKRYLRKKSMPITTARTRDNIYLKPLALPTKRYTKKHRYSERINYCHFCILCLHISYSFVLTWASETLWQAPHRWPFLKEQLPRLRKPSGKGLDTSGHIQFNWRNHTSSAWRRLWGRNFQIHIWRRSFHQLFTFEWSPIQIP